MKLSHVLTPLLAIGATAAPPRPHGKPAYFILAGDSTTAPDGGWGDGFLSTAVRSPAGGINLGHSGATTVSFRNGGDWAHVLEEVKNHTRSHNVFVTIQVSLAAHSPNPKPKPSSFLTKLTVRPQRPKTRKEHLPLRLCHQSAHFRLRDPLSKRHTHPRLLSHPPLLHRHATSSRRKPRQRAQRHNNRR